MPLVPKPIISKCCNSLCEVVEARLICELCQYRKHIKLEDLDVLPRNWPDHHDEYMSLVCRNRCTKCNGEIEEVFSKGRVPLDCLPGTYDTRVFIGGNYDLIANLRYIKDAVYKIEGKFAPILPYDDFAIPPNQVYESDLRLLHNCKHAIFEVTQPAGELFEIARCAEYRVRTLFVYQSRGPAEAPPRARTMLLESGSHEHRSYRDSRHLENIVNDFLMQKKPEQWEKLHIIRGHHVEEVYIYHKFNLNREGETICAYNGLKVDIPNYSLPGIPHRVGITIGNIVEVSSKSEGPGRIIWHKDNSTSSSRVESGVMEFDPPLNSNTEPLNYMISYITKDACLLSKEQALELHPDEIDEMLFGSSREYSSTVVGMPAVKLKMSVDFPQGYQVNSMPFAYFGREPCSDALMIPPDRFTFDGSTAILEVYRPRLDCEYAIAWDLPSVLNKD